MVSICCDEQAFSVEVGAVDEDLDIDTLPFDRYGWLDVAKACESAL